MVDNSIADGKGNVLRNKYFRRFLGMRLSSFSASSVTSLVLVWYVYAVTASAIDVAIIGITETVSALIIMLPAGVWADRYNRVKLLSLSTAVRSLGVTLLIIFTAYLGFYLIAVIALVFVLGALAELYRSSNLSSLPEMVGKGNLADANGIVETGSNLLRSASNGIAGVLYSLAGLVVALSFGAIGFFAAFLFAIALLGFKGNKPVPRFRESGEKKGAFVEIREGFAWLISQRGLLWLTVSSLPFNFFFYMSYYFLVVYVKTGLGSGSLIFGGILAANALGFSIGVMIVGRVKWAIKRAGKVWVLVYGGGIGTSLLFMSLLPNPYLGAIFFFAMGLALGFGGNVWVTSAQHIVPSELRGRYFAVDGLISFLGGPPAIAAGGVLVLLFGVIHVYEISGILILISVLGFSMIRSLWTLDGTVTAKSVS